MYGAYRCVWFIVRDGMLLLVKGSEYWNGPDGSYQFGLKAYGSTRMLPPLEHTAVCEGLGATVVRRCL